MSLVNRNNMFGCFVSGPSLVWDATQKDEEEAEEKGKLFRQFIWGDNGIDQVLKQVINIEYGTEVKLILFQFYLNPLQYEMDNLAKTEGYRKREKSLAKSIVITDENFFRKGKAEQELFLKETILESLNELQKEYKNKLDTRFNLLHRELYKLFDLCDKNV